MKTTKSDRVPVRTAARIIGVLPQYLQQEMRLGHIDLGYVSKGKKKCTYIIFRAKLERLIGRELTEDELNENGNANG